VVDVISGSFPESGMLPFVSKNLASAAHSTQKVDFSDKFDILGSVRISCTESLNVGGVKHLKIFYIASLKFNSFEKFLDFPFTKALNSSFSAAFWGSF
jgi:hypothetical protein